MQVEVNDTKYEYNEEYSFKNYVNQVCDVPDGTVVYSSSFYFEVPDSTPFRSDMTNVTFIKCNLDNLLIPEGNILIECSNKRFESQNDLNDWVIDDTGIPVIPVCGKEVFIKQGLPVPDPNDIPLEKVDTPINLFN